MLGFSVQLRALIIIVSLFYCLNITLGSKEEMILRAANQLRSAESFIHVIIPFEESFTDISLVDTISMTLDSPFVLGFLNMNSTDTRSFHVATQCYH